MNRLRDTTSTPPLLGPNTVQFKRSVDSQGFRAVSVTSPDSTITRGIKETEALSEDVGQSLAQLKPMQAKLMQEKDEHA